MHHRDPRHRALPAFLLITLALFSANLVGGILSTQSGGTALPLVRNTLPSDGTVLEWPTDPPMAWPPPTLVMESRNRLMEDWSAYSGPDGQTTHQMRLYRYGWPLRVLERSERWWPWQDPQWQTDAPPDTGLQIIWVNALAIPVAAGSTVALLIVLAATIRIRLRRRQDRCIACGYRLQGAASCAECGLIRAAAR